MNIELLEFEKNVSVNYKIGERFFTSNINDYDITHYSKQALEKLYFPYLVDHIAKTLKGLMLNADRNEPSSDNVNKPSHYAVLPGVEVIDIRKALLKKIPTDTSFEAVDHWSRAWEYLTRMWGKNGIEDAKKAKVYLNWLIDELERSKPE